MAMARGKIRTSERNGYESFYLPGEQYTAVAVEPILVWARHGCLSRSLIHSGQEIRGTKVHRNALVDERRYGRDHLEEFQLRCWEPRRIGIEIACTGRDDVLCYQNYGGSTRGKLCGRLGACKFLPGQSPLQRILNLNLFGHKCV